MKLTLQLPKKSLSKAFLKQRPLKYNLYNFRNNLSKLLSKIDEIEREENQKNHVRDFLLNSFYKDFYELNTKDVKDLVIHTGKTNKSSVGVIIETKRPGNKGEMITLEKPNCKAFQELVLYYLHERIDEKNIDIKYCIATNIYEWFIFDASYFEKYFYANKKFVKQYEEWRQGQKVTGDTNLFYNDIARPYIDSIDEEIPVVYFDLREFIQDPDKQDEEKDKKLIVLFKLLSPYHLLRVPFADDSNKLDEMFYKELLHIIGLEEVKEGSKHIIRRKESDKRNAGSLLENAISKLSILDSIDRVSDSSVYGETKDEKNFNIALELCLTWINRILFLKLLEAQLIIYHKGFNSNDYKFLYPGKLKDFDELFSLFHHVLAVPEKEREADVREKFKLVPYLNSTLFEISQLEKETINISNLNDSLPLEIIKNSILDDGKSKTKSLTSLEYILKFLDAYDFSSEGAGDVMEESRTLINASVLGKVFEKINGYKDGSIFTPGFITMYMCREAIRLAVTQKFRDKYNWKADTFDDVKNFITDKRSRDDVLEFNEVIDSIKICDPAVGSGHFLVSSLNEMIAIKSELGIFADEHGTRIPDYDITVEQDELIVTDRNGDIFEYKLSPSASGEGFKVRPETQKLQRTLFHEKQKLIENCLFGVDINPNSVKICMLRLWIELLKNAYYRPPTGALLKEGELSNELETLPNIDINIKTGNSLISRFPLDANLSKFGQKERNIIEQYRNSVRDYKNEKNRSRKKELEGIIRNLKNDIRTDISKKDPKLVKLNNIKSELDNLENQTGLFEQTKKEQKEQAAKKKKLEAELAKLNKEVDDIRSNAIYRNAFEWRFEFPEVLNGEGEFEGFDVVISNPPYIRQEELSPIKEYLKSKFKVFISGGDIFSYFYEVSHSILKVNGKFAFINNTFDKTTAGKTLREFISSNFELIKYIDFTSVVVFEEATTYPIILIANKNINYSTFCYFKFNIENFKNKDIVNNSSIFSKFDQTSLNISAWNFSNKIESDLLMKIQQNKKLFEIYGKSYRGIITGLNEAFIVENKFKDFDIIKPVFEGKDIKKWHTTVPFKNMIVFKSKSTKSKFGELSESEALSKMKLMYPDIMNYLVDFEEPAKKRLDKGEYWWELRNCAYYDLLEKPKIIFPNLQNVNKFAYDVNGEYLNAPAVFLPTNDVYLLAILNSKVVWHFLKSICVIRSGGYIEVKPQYFEQIPIPEISEIEKEPFIKLVNEILELKKQGKDTTELECKIDRMAYELYGLTEEEIGIVAGKEN